MWSMRRSKANFSRLMGVFLSLVGMLKRWEAIRNWKNPVSSALFMILFLTLVMLPAFIIPTILLYLAFVGLWNYRYRPRHPPHFNTRLSHADIAHPDELDEEFDTNLSRASADIVRMRYDRLRSVAGKIQTLGEDVATIGERFQGLLTWKDPRITFLFMVLCSVVAVGFCVVPIQLVVTLLGLYSLRPPRLRSKQPSLVACFFRRLPVLIGIYDACFLRTLPLSISVYDSELLAWTGESADYAHNIF